MGKMEAEDMIKARVAKAADQAAKDAVAIKDFKEQVGEYRKTVQTLHMEIDSLRSANDSLNTNRNLLEGEEQRLDSHTSEHVGDYMNQMRFQQQPMQVMQPPQQEELQTVTHKKVVVRTIQTRDGQVVAQSEDVRESNE